jgi:hypothetical protein
MGSRVALTLALSGLACGAVAPGITREALPHLYAHNDYYNERPFHDAVAHGCVGMEVDVFREHGELLVGHDRSELRVGRSLESLYLHALRDWIHSHRPHERPRLVLMIDLKERDPEAYELLRRALAEFEGVITVVREGREERRSIDVVLVGWAPSLRALAREPVRYVSVHRYAGQLSDVDAPAHLVRLVSVDYSKSIDWSGAGAKPRFVTRKLRRAREATDRVPGRFLRIHAAPARASVYGAFAAAGVDFIGARHLSRAREVLRAVRAGMGADLR